METPSSLFIDWRIRVNFLTTLLSKFKTPVSKPPPLNVKPVDISFSRLQTYMRCPWMYHLVYALGWRSGPNSGMAMGLSLHRALAAYHAPENSEKTLDRLWGIYDEVWVNEGFGSTQETLDAYDNGRKILEQYFRTDQHRTSSILSTEKEYSTLLEGPISFHWTLDRLDRYADGTHEIVEYKSNHHHWTEARKETDLQMTLYAFAMQKTLGPVPLKLRYHFLSSNEQVETHRSLEQLQSAEELVKSIADKIRHNEFEPHFEHCPKCEFANRCTKVQKSTPWKGNA